MPLRVYEQGEDRKWIFDDPFESFTAPLTGPLPAGLLRRQAQEAAWAQHGRYVAPPVAGGLRPIGRGDKESADDLPLTRQQFTPLPKAPPLTLEALNRYASFTGHSVTDDEDDGEDEGPGHGEPVRGGLLELFLAFGSDFETINEQGVEAAIAATLSHILGADRAERVLSDAVAADVDTTVEDTDDVIEVLTAVLGAGVSAVHDSVIASEGRVLAALTTALSGMCERTAGAIEASEGRVVTILQTILDALPAGTATPNDEETLESDGVTLDDIEDVFERVLGGLNVEVDWSDDIADGVAARIGGVIGSFFGFGQRQGGVKRWLNSAFQGVLDWLNDWRRTAKALFRSLLSAVTNLENTLARLIKAQADKVIARLGDKIDARYRSTVGAVQDAANRVIGRINDRLTNVQDSVLINRRVITERVTAEAAKTRAAGAASEGRIVAAVEREGLQSREAAAATHDALFGTVRSEAATTREQGETWGERLSGAIAGVAGDVSSALLGDYDSLGDALANIVRVDLSPALQWIERLLGVERAATQGVLDAVGEIVDKVQPAASPEAAAIEAQTPAVESQAESLDEIADYIRTIVHGTDSAENRRKTDAVINELVLGTWAQPRPSQRRIDAAKRALFAIATSDESCNTKDVGIALWGKDYDSTDDAQLQVNSWLLDALGDGYEMVAGAAAGLVEWLINGAAAPLFRMLTLAQVSSQCVELAWLYEHPITPLGAPDVLRLHRWRTIDTATALDALRQHGINPERAQALLSTNHVAPAAGAALDAWHRELVTDDYVDDVLRRIGLTPNDAKMLKAQSYYRPPPSDLILMAVRDVFAPAARRRLSLDEDYPEAFDAAARKLGMTSETARDYWAAHWTLPSLGQGYSMLHRRVIDDATLDDLLRAKDIAPVWRDKLKAISYRALNRVDVRRMYSVGTLDADQVLKAYQDLGYDERNAALMRDFTVAWADAAEPSEDELETRGLTRSLVLRLYADGAVDKEQATALLTEAGTGEDVAALWLTATDLDTESHVQAERVDTVLVRVREGLDSESDAKRALALMDLTLDERRVIDERLEQALKRRQRLPSRADLDRAAKRGLVERQEYLDTLVRQGYSATWAERYWTMGTT